jgi:hypothetical protein
MNGILLQDWVTIRGVNGPVASIAQGAHSWLELGDYEDLAFIIDVADITPVPPNAPQIVYETSPNKHEASFRAMVNPFTPAVGQRVDRVFAAYAGVPGARFVRWRISTISTNTYDITFRIFVSAYAWTKP